MGRVAYQSNSAIEEFVCLLRAQFPDGFVLDAVSVSCYMMSDGNTPIDLSMAAITKPLSLVSSSLSRFSALMATGTWRTKTPLS